jgi:DNA-binding transcriptional MerR regulator
MRKPLSQLPLDFGGEDPQASPPGGAHASHREGEYLAAPGVGVRVKSFKKPAATAGHEELFAEAPTTATPAPPEPVTAIPAAAIPVTATIPVTAIPTDAISAAPAPAAPAPIAPAPVASAPAAEAHPLQTAEPATGMPVAEVQASKALRPRRGPTPTNGKAALKPIPSKRGRKSLKQVTAEADLIEIPADEALFSKQYYTMGEVSEMFKVNQSLLRYWETEFDILQPRKNKKGDRYFRPIDIKNLHLIYHLLRQKKYTIEGAKEFLRNNKKANERFEVIERLRLIRNFLLEMKTQL